MNTMKMITAMCAMGSTENMGTFATPYKDDVADFIKDFFSGVNEEVEVIGEIEEDTNYLYIYDERLGNNMPNAIVEVYEGVNKVAGICLYEIED
jgi:hypothetical protein